MKRGCGKLSSLIFMTTKVINITLKTAEGNMSIKPTPSRSIVNFVPNLVQGLTILKASHGTTKNG